MLGSWMAELPPQGLKSKGHPVDSLHEGRQKVNEAAAGKWYLQVGDAIHRSPFNGDLHPPKLAKRDNSRRHSTHQPRANAPLALSRSLWTHLPPLLQSSAAPLRRQAACVPSAKADHRAARVTCVTPSLLQAPSFPANARLSRRGAQTRFPPLSIFPDPRAIFLFALTTPNLEGFRLESGREGRRGTEDRRLFPERRVDCCGAALRRGECSSRQAEEAVEPLDLRSLALRLTPPFTLSPGSRSIYSSLPLFLVPYASEVILSSHRSR